MSGFKLVVRVELVTNDGSYSPKPLLLVERTGLIAQGGDLVSSDGLNLIGTDVALVINEALTEARDQLVALAATLNEETT